MYALILPLLFGGPVQVEADIFAIAGLFRENVIAAETGDSEQIDNQISTQVERSDRASTLRMVKVMGDVLQQHGARIKIAARFRLVWLDAERAYVMVDQVTGIDGHVPAFRPNVTTYNQNVLRDDDGVWRLGRTRITSIHYIDEPKPAPRGWLTAAGLAR